MTPSRPAAVPSPPTRRARQRAATIGEIKALARRQLAEQGPGGLSLRAIARTMGTAPSALYRYFPSQSDLVTELCAEAYDSLAAALTAGRDAQPPGDHARRWLAVCHAYRRWSLDHPADFALIFGTPLPGYHAPPGVTAAAAGRAIGVAADVYAAAVQAGAADPGRTQVPAGLQTGALWAALAGHGAPDREPALAGIVLTAWASLLGYLVTEIFGSLTALTSDPDALYQAHVRTVTLGMGFRPALTESSARGEG
jgi:AcrR family transcriptional regulator